MNNILSIFFALATKTRILTIKDYIGFALIALVTLYIIAPIIIYRSKKRQLREGESMRKVNAARAESNRRAELEKKIW